MFSGSYSLRILLTSLAMVFKILSICNELFFCLSYFIHSPTLGLPSHFLFMFQFNNDVIWQKGFYLIMVLLTLLFVFFTYLSASSKLTASSLCNDIQNLTVLISFFSVMRKREHNKAHEVSNLYIQVTRWLDPGHLNVAHPFVLWMCILGSFISYTLP